MTKYWGGLLIGLIAGAVLPGTAAMAQSVTPNIGDSALPYSANRGRNVGVLERSRAQFEPTGVRVGGFNVRSRVQVGLTYIDNIYGSASAPSGDGAASIAPSVDVRSGWSQNSLNLSAGAQLLRYFTFSRENQTSWYVEPSGHVDLTSDLRLEGVATRSRVYEPRYAQGSPGNAVKPIPIDIGSIVTRAIYQAGRHRGIVAVSVRDIDYGNVPSIGGGIVDQRFRDRSNSRVEGRYEYALSPDTSLFAQASYAQIRYPKELAPADDQSSDETMLMAGVSFDLTALVRSTLAVGYVRREFEQPVFQTMEGVTADLRLQYFITQLTTISLIGRREINDSPFRGTGAYFSNSVRARADHELLRNLLLYVQADFERTSFKQVERRDRITWLSGGARYLANRTVEFGLTGSVGQRRSRGSVSRPDIDESRVLVSATWKH
jgi:hypothetical protein